MIRIKNATILTPSKRINNGSLVVRGERIAAIGEKINRDISSTNTFDIDGQGGFIVPGFIDLQINGAFGCDFTRSPKSMWEVAKQLPKYGVTSFLPTIVTSPLEKIEVAQDVLLNKKPSGFLGARPHGLHLEGPFLNKVKSGAHNPKYVLEPSINIAANWEPKQGVCMVTLAPELPGALELISFLDRRGVVVSLGHSNASYWQAVRGIDAGARYATHLFNAMPPFLHRKPGLVGALMDDDRTTVGLIVDGTHVDPAVVRLVWRLLGENRLNLVTDAMEALGEKTGDYRVHDFKVIVDDSSARLTDGTLAGSILSLDSALRNLVAMTGCEYAQAIKTVTTTPADLLRVPELNGRLEIGSTADIVLMTKEYEVMLTIAAGEVVYLDEIKLNTQTNFNLPNVVNKIQNKKIQGGIDVVETA